MASTAKDLQSVCKDPDANPVSLAKLLDESTGKEWWDWEPETVAHFAGLSKLDVQPLDKLMAIQVGLTNPDVFEEWVLFHHCAVAYGNRRVNFTWLDRISYLEAAWACEVLKELNPQHSFGPGVLKYLEVICNHDGVIFFPWIGGEGLMVGVEDNLARRLKEEWQKGTLADLAPSEVDDEDMFQVQLAKLVNGCEFIRLHRKQKPK